MTEKSRYFVLKQKAVPEVLLKVVEVKRLLASEKGITVQEATEEAGISRSSYYKYRDDIFPFHDETKGKTVTFMLQMEDEPGLLSKVIHQSIPINGMASLTLSVEVQSSTGDVSAMIEKIEGQPSVRDLKILGRE